MVAFMFYSNIDIFIFYLKIQKDKPESDPEGGTTMESTIRQKLAGIPGFESIIHILTGMSVAALLSLPYIFREHAALTFLALYFTSFWSFLGLSILLKTGGNSDIIKQLLVFMFAISFFVTWIAMLAVRPQYFLQIFGVLQGIAILLNYIRSYWPALPSEP